MPLILMEVDIMVRLGQLVSRFKLVCFFLVFFSCSEKKDAVVLNYSESELDLFKNVVAYKNFPLSGKVYKLYSKTVDTLWVRNYKNGVKNGVWKKYYPDGSLKEIRQFINGEKEGDFLGYYNSGAKNFVFQFVDGEYDGTNKIWTNKGLLIELGNFKKGYELGVQKTWYLNGKIKSNYIIKNNRRYGLLGTKNCINVSKDFIKI